MILMAWESIILGLIQGILEWLPVSSQGNLVLIMVALLGIDKAQALNLSIYLHLGTFLSALLYFRKIFISLLKALPSYNPRNVSSDENRLISFLLFTTVLTGLVGFPIYVFVGSTEYSGELFIALVGIGLIITGLVQKYAPRLGNRKMETLSFTDTLSVGIIQGFSSYPGVSRSGLTVSSLLFRGFSTESALKLSFLMSVPTVLAAQIGLALISGLEAVNSVDILLGCCASFISGLLSIHIMLKIAGKIRFWLFCIVLGVIALLPLLGFI
jgi:undecaprenyl-diphosphatase